MENDEPLRAQLLHCDATITAHIRVDQLINKRIDELIYAKVRLQEERNMVDRERQLILEHLARVPS